MIAESGSTPRRLIVVAQPTARPRGRGPSGSILGALLTATIVAAAGCAGTLQQLGVQSPTAGVDGVRFGSLSLTTVGLLVDVRVNNPYTLELPVVEFDYSLSSSGTPFLSGKAPSQGAIPARGSKVVTVPVQVQLAELVRTVSGVRPGQVVPWRLAAGITIDPPALAPMRLPLTTTGELPVPVVPRVAVSGIRWDKLALDGVRGTLAVELENPNAFPMTLSRLTYALDLAGTTVASAEQASSQQVAAGGRQRLELPLSFSPASAGLAMLQAMGRSSATYAMTGGLRVTTPFGNMDMPFSASGQTPLAH